MPGNKEIRLKINSEQNMSRFLGAVAVISGKQLTEAKTEIVSKRPFYKGTSAMFERMSQETELLRGHPLTVLHPNATRTSVILVAPESEFFCKALVNTQQEYIENQYPAETTSMIEAQKQDPEQLARSVIDDYSQGNFKSVRVVYFTQTLELEDTVLLPILPKNNDQKAPSSILRIEGEPDVLFDLLLLEYLSNIIGDSLLQTRVAECLLRMTTAQRGVKNIEEDLLPGLQSWLNHLRQSKTTTELTELTATIEALGLKE